MAQEINLPPFYVGQRVVCINDEIIFAGLPSAPIKNGTIYTVAGVLKVCCRWHIDIGLYSGRSHVRCPSCYGDILKPNMNYWLAAFRFAPIEENFQSISLEKVLEKETPLISVN